VFKTVKMLPSIITNNCCWDLI